MTSSEPVAETIATYDEIAPTYSQCFCAAVPHAHRDWFLVSLPAARRVVLDAGCGAGRDLGALTAGGGRPIGMDLSAGMPAVAQPHRAAPLVRSDLRALPFPLACFGGAWCCAALLHLPGAKVAMALDELRRVLPPGGPMYLSLRTNGTDGYQDFAGRRRWYTHHTASGAVGLLDASGFTTLVIESESDGAGRDGVQWLAIHAVAR